jgi:hypothetical protein
MLGPVKVERIRYMLNGELMADHIPQHGIEPMHSADALIDGVWCRVQSRIEALDVVTLVYDCEPMEVDQPSTVTSKPAGQLSDQTHAHPSPTLKGN